MVALGDGRWRFGNRVVSDGRAHAALHLARHAPMRPTGRLTAEQERAHAIYAAGRYGGLILTPQGWEAVPLAAPEIRLADFAPARHPERAGWLSFLRKRR